MRLTQEACRRLGHSAIRTEGTRRVFLREERTLIERGRESSGRALGALLAALACLALLASCTVRLVAEYDDVIDTGVTELHKELTAFLLDMNEKAGTPAGKYASNTEFYVQAKAAAASLVLRAKSSPKNSITTKELELLRDNLDRLAEVHKEQEELGLNDETFEASKIPFDVHFEAILKFEIAKKRGE